jgi:hypothetical protein
MQTQSATAFEAARISAAMVLMDSASAAALKLI